LKTYYVSPLGSPGNSGDIGSPIDLQTAFSASSRVLPGDLVWLRGGTYTHAPQGVASGNEGFIFQVTVSGVAGANIVFRGYPGEQARIDGGAFGGGALAYHATARPVIKVGDSGNAALGNFVTLQDLEVFSSSSEKRLSTDDTSFPLDLTRSDGINIYGSGVKILNCIVHDLTTGISAWTQSKDAEIYGNLIFNCGWQGSVHQHGHNLYLQHGAAGAGYKTIKRNLLVSPFDRNAQMYGSSNAECSHFRFAENIAIGLQGQRGEVLIGTRTGGLADRCVDNQITDNFLYGADLTTVYQPDPNAYRDLVVTNNYLVKSKVGLGSWKSLSFYGNTLIDVADITYGNVALGLNSGVVIPWSFDRNFYVFSAPGASVFDMGTGAMSLAAWRTKTGYDLNSTVGAVPTVPKVVVQNNVYDANRAHVAVCNWGNASTMAVNVASLGWAPGTIVTVRNAQNYFLDIASATVQADGTIPINLAMARLPAVPYGASAAPVPSTFPAFGAFVLIRTVAAFPPPPVPSTLTPLETLSAQVTAAQNATADPQTKQTLGFIQSLITETKKL
jgi:hypothetical protein